MGQQSIVIIGGGNLGSAITEGLLASKYCKAAQITLTRRNTSALEIFTRRGVNVTSNNKAAVKNANVIILCVKPFQIKDVLKDIASGLSKNQVLISAVSGVMIEEINQITKDKIPVLRAMPNTAMAIRQSMTCLACENGNEQKLTIAQDIFNALGRTIVIDEKLMDAATILGACGTAFALRYIRANIQAGIEIGFDANTARLIAAQTVMGAAELLLKHGTHPEQEIDKVTTPRGVTITGLNQMDITVSVRPS